MFKLDLHTHSVASPDGSLSLRDYSQTLKTGSLDVIAITDHNTIDFAQKAQLELGEKIIVGEEIMTDQGEIIGLYLHDLVKPNQTPRETVRAIRAQDGLVYVPHPFETIRSGLSYKALNDIADEVDIVEVWNGRALLQNRAKQARNWAKKHGIAGAASSDAHGRIGWSRTYTQINALPARDTLVTILLTGEVRLKTVGLGGVMYPKYNRIRKKFFHV